ncbi:MAG: hypothetical protein KBD01_05180 [Acidobacteria bacterium]|nr:hypothetical protein [Acidobacteriota bacterium]
MDWRDNSGYTHLELYPDGTYKSFVPEVDTEWLIEGARVVLKASFAVTLHTNGGLRRCVLAAPAALSVLGVPVVVAADEPLELHENGALHAFTLGSRSEWKPWRNRPWTYRGASYAPGTRLELSADGAVVSATEGRGP